MNPMEPFFGAKRIKGTWDMGVDYGLAKNGIERKLGAATKSNIYSNWAVLLIQLLNGSRISEATEAWNKFLNTNQRELEVGVRKLNAENAENRKMIIPPTLEQKGVPRNAGCVTTFAHRQGANTHSLRYAFIGHLGAQRTAPQIIAKITHHKKLDRILLYTQQKVADDILKQAVAAKSE